MVAGRGRFTQQKRRAGRRVHLVLVVHFQDFDVPVLRIQRLRRLLRQNAEQVDAKAHIARLDDARMARRRLEFSSSSGEQPVVPMICTMRACAARPAKVTLVAGEVKSITPSAWRKACSGSLVISTPMGPRPALAGIATDKGRAFTCDGGMQLDAWCLVNEADERLSHAARRADHHQFHAAAAHVFTHFSCRADRNPPVSDV